MATSPFAPFMTQTLSLERKTGVDANNQSLYGTPETVACRHAKRARRAQSETGWLIIGEDLVRCPPTTGLKAGDRVTLPDGRKALIRLVTKADIAGEVWTERAICE